MHARSTVPSTTGRILSSSFELRRIVLRVREAASAIRNQRALGHKRFEASFEPLLSQDWGACEPMPCGPAKKLRARSCRGLRSLSQRPREYLPGRSWRRAMAASLARAMPHRRGLGSLVKGLTRCSSRLHGQVEECTVPVAWTCSNFSVAARSRR